MPGFGVCRRSGNLLVASSPAVASRNVPGTELSLGFDGIGGAVGPVETDVVLCRDPVFIIYETLSDQNRIVGLYFQLFGDAFQVPVLLFRHKIEVVAARVRVLLHDVMHLPQQLFEALKQKGGIVFPVKFSKCGTESWVAEE